jgi:uncharacterized membrane protein YraQ (UPF0718 family)
MINAVIRALEMALAMGWEILWPLILGFALSAVVQAVVSKQQMSQLLPDDRPRSIATALALGAASSSCSYAAVALARSIFRKGAHFTAAMAFEMASTNLVVELGTIMLVLLGWQFTLAEFVGAPLMVVFLILFFRMFLSRDLLDQTKKQTDKGVAGRMEGHAEMDMSVTEGGSLWQRITSDRGLTAISHYFVMDWAAVWLDIVGGLLIAGALAAWVPNAFWQSFFLTKHPVLATLWGPIVGPLVAVISFVCSVGNIPLAAVLWNGGISFRRSDRLHLRRPDRPPDPEHLSQVLWAEDGRLLVRYFLRRHGGRGADRRSNLRRLRSHPARAQGSGGRGLHHLELYQLAEPGFSGSRRLLVWRFLETGGPAMLRMMNSPVNHGDADQHAH